MNFFDTNVLVAAAIPQHPHHPQSSARMSLLRQSKSACAAHALAETYNTLTRTKPYNLPGFAAHKIVEQASKEFDLVSLTPKEILQTIQAAAQADILGLRIFDALLITCARKVNAKRIYTNDIKHFREIAPDLASRIVEP